jgi:hypothetical protein
MTKLLLSGLACCSLLTADFSAPAWHYRRPLTVSPATPISEFTIDASLYRDSAANLDDLRILRNNTETPYVILTLAGSRETIEPPATIVNKAWVPGTGVQAILDLKGHAEHNRLRIGTPLHNFKETVRVETSDDTHTWAVVQSAGLIFDVLRDDHAAAETTISYPTSTRRFVRLTIPGWTEPANLQAVWLSAFKETGATRDLVATLSPSVQEDAKTQTTELILDLGFSGQPFDHINLAVGPGLFSRTIEIAGSNDRQHFYATSGGVIFRTSDSEQLSLDIPERSERYLKISIFNADSAPLHFGPVTLSGIRRVVEFSSAQPGAYFVYFGNSNARQPSYDFARILPAAGLPASAKLGNLEPNPLFRLPERPWTDRNPWLLNSALVTAVAAMGLVTLRMLKKVT